MKWPISLRISVILARLLYRFARFSILLIGFTLLTILFLEPIVPEPENPRCDEHSTIAQQTLESFPTLSSADVQLSLSKSLFQDAINNIAKSRLILNLNSVDLFEINAHFGQPALLFSFCSAKVRSPIDIRLRELTLVRFEAETLISYTEGRYVRFEKSDDAKFRIYFSIDTQSIRLRYSLWETVSGWFPKVFRHLEQKAATLISSENFSVDVPVILPVLTGFSGRIHAAIFSF